MTCRRHHPAVPTKYEAGWAAGPDCTYGRTDTSCSFWESKVRGPWSFSLLLCDKHFYLSRWSYGAKDRSVYSYWHIKKGRKTVNFAVALDCLQFPIQISPKQCRRFIYNSTDWCTTLMLSVTYSYTWFAATCFDVNTSSSGSLLCLAKITYIVDINKMELLKYKIWSTKYKITVFHNMLVPFYQEQ